MRGAAGIGLGTSAKYLTLTMSGAAGSGLGTMIKYLRRTTSAAANNGLSTTITPPCTVAAFGINSKPHTRARPSIRLCVGPELAHCVHYEGARMVYPLTWPAQPLGFPASTRRAGRR
jgi:hypothetical protein